MRHKTKMNERKKKDQMVKNERKKDNETLNDMT